MSQAQERGFYYTFGPDKGAGTVHGPDGREVAFRFGGRNSMAKMAAAIIRGWNNGARGIEDRLTAMEQQLRLMAIAPFSPFAAKGRAGDMWVEPVRGDRMSPTLRHMQDFVIVRRAKRYEGEAVYLLNHVAGDPFITRAAGALNRKREVALYCDNKFYSEHTVAQDWFDKHVIGIVVADVKVRETRELSPLADCA